MVQFSIVKMFCSSNKKITSQPHLLNGLNYQVTTSTEPLLHAHWYYLEYKITVFFHFSNFNVDIPNPNFILSV